MLHWFLIQQDASISESVASSKMQFDAAAAQSELAELDRRILIWDEFLSMLAASPTLFNKLDVEFFTAEKLVVQKSATELRTMLESQIEERVKARRDMVETFLRRHNAFMSGATFKRWTEQNRLFAQGSMSH